MAFGRRSRDRQRPDAGAARSEGHAARAGRQAWRRELPRRKRRSNRRDMRISHFFIDRPIFASVLSIVFVILGARRFRAAADRAISGDRSADDHGLRPVSRRQRRSGRLHRRHADRAADQRRREYDLHVLELDRRRALSISVTFDIGTNLDIAQVQVQNRVAIAQPRLPADVRNIGVTVNKSFARPDDGRASLFAGQIARHVVHLQLCHARDHRRPYARRRRRLDHRVRLRATTRCASGSIPTGCSRSA